jgi:hypothetical protein
LKDRPYQFPVQVGSLTTSVEEQSSMLKRGDNVAGGNLASSRCVHRGCPKGIDKRETPSQPKRQGKSADRRQTNYVGVVKVTQMESWMSGDCEWRPVVLSGKSETREEEMGESTFGAHRRKSRWYVFNGHFMRNWGDLDMSRRGKREYKVEYPLKTFLKHIKESEMTIVALILRVSKALRSEGSLVFSVCFGGRSA